VSGGVTALSFTGAGDVIIDALTDNDGIETVDLTAQTGAFEMVALSEGATFKFGNSGDIELTAVVNSKDVFEFTTAFDNEVMITGGEFGGDVSDDDIDLSALGVASLDELEFTDNGGNLEITSVAAEDGTQAFAGTIVLVGVTANQVNTDDFIFG
jgi:hypothetical protein